MGRWARDVVKLSKDVFCWTILAIAQCCHKVTDAIMTEGNRFSLRRDKSLAELGHLGGILFQLSTGLADWQASDFSDQLSEATNWKPILLDVEVADLDSANQLIVLLNLKHSAEYERRVHFKIRQFL